MRLTLEEALRLAQERQVQAIVGQERVQQALTRISQAKSALYPQFQGNVSQYRRTFNLSTVGIDIPLPGFSPLVGPFNTMDARIYLTQTLFDATVLSRLKEAKLGHYLSQAQSQQAKLDAMALVANLFLEAQRAQNRIPWVKAQWLREQTRRNLAQTQKRIGLGSSVEVTQATASWEQAKANLGAAETQALERRLDLAAALGLPQDQPIRFVLEDRIDRLPVPKAGELQTLVASHPQVESARRQVSQRTQERKTEVAAFYPQLSANADYGASGEDPSNVDDTYNFGGQLTIPIFQGGLRRARVKEAESRIRESQSQLTDTLNQQEAKAKQALASMNQSLEVWRAADANLTLARQQMNLAQSRLGSGLGSQLDVVDARADQAVALDQKADAVTTYYQAKVNLAYSSGTLFQWVEGATPQ